MNGHQGSVAMRYLSGLATKTAAAPHEEAAY